MSLGFFERIKHNVLLTNPEWTKEEAEEKIMKRRLDIFFCSWASLSAIVKYLDQTNISNGKSDPLLSAAPDAAYVSGMKEDLQLYGNELNLFTTYFNIGYLVCIPLSTYVMNSRLRPSIWMPTTELIWGILTGVLAASKNAQMIYGVRFLIGFAEGTAWPGTMVLILSWYKPSELGKRLAIYQCATSLGGIFSGALQAALYTNLNGAGGLAGWQWLFVVNSCITVVVAFWGYVACPDYPNRPNPAARWWLRDSDVEIAQSRMASVNRKLPTGFSWKVIRSVVSRPQNWMIWLAYELNGQGNTGNGYFNLWLKSLKNGTVARYTVQQINTIPIAASCIGILSLATFLTWSDRVQIRYPFILGLLLWGVIWSGVLANGNVSDGVKMTSYLALNLTAANTNLFIAWLSELCKHSAEERAIVISSFVTSFYAIAAGLPLVIWPASKAPNWPIGFKYATGMFGAAFLAVIALVFLERRQWRIDALQEDDELRSGEGSFDHGAEVKTPGVEDQPALQQLDEKARKI